MMKKLFARAVGCLNLRSRKLVLAALALIVGIAPGSTALAQQVCLVLTPVQWTWANDWLNTNNGWPDNKGNENYSNPIVFDDYANVATTPALSALVGKHGLVLDRAMIRNLPNSPADQPETRKDKIERIATWVRGQLADPTVVRIVATNDFEQPLAATFTDVTAQAVDRVRELVDDTVVQPPPAEEP